MKTTTNKKIKNKTKWIIIIIKELQILLLFKMLCACLLKANLQIFAHRQFAQNGRWNTSVGVRLLSAPGIPQSCQCLIVLKYTINFLKRNLKCLKYYKPFALFCVLSDRSLTVDRKTSQTLLTWNKLCLSKVRTHVYSFYDEGNFF